MNIINLSVINYFTNVDLFFFRVDSLIEEYKREVARLRDLGKSWNLTDEQIDKVIEKSFKVVENECSKETKLFNLRGTRQFWMIFTLVLICGIMIFQTSSFSVIRKNVNNYIERNVQEIIYPGMKLFRKLMLPIIIIFPSLTGNITHLYFM